MSGLDIAGIWRDFHRHAEPLCQQFRQAHLNPDEHQRQILANILAQNANTLFGQKYEFSTIRSYEDYQSRVGVMTGEEFQCWSKKIANGTHHVLTRQTVQFFEPTSGSSAKRKLVPYTAKLIEEFQRAIIVWLAVLYEQCPAIASGRAYWAMSPSAAPTEETPSGIAIGGAGDAGYLAGSIAMPLLQTVLNPPIFQGDTEHWRKLSLKALIEAEDLSMISVWSPTFLSSLLEPLFDSESEQLQTLRNEILTELSPSRQSAVLQAIAEKDLGMLWPNLALISCWMDGPSQQFSQNLKPLFPRTLFSHKGLLATEGVVSVSWGTSVSCPLALDSHFLEFLSDDGCIVLAGGLVPGQCYRPLLTTSGGLYRYLLGDVIRIENPIDDLLSARFQGREGTVCDLVGEKLDEPLATAICKTALEQGCHTVLVPNADATCPHYVLLVNTNSSDVLLQCQKEIEKALNEVHHYAYACSHAQLGPLQPVQVPNLASVLQRAWEATGARAGDYKPSHLIHSPAMAQHILQELSAMHPSYPRPSQ